MEARLAQRFEAAAPGGQDIAYGASPLQHIDFWRAKAAAADAPLVLFVHGGGWTRGDKRNATGATKVTHYLDLGYAFASINYRLVPDATVEQQAQDVADAVAALVARAKALGFDPRKVVLMGHSAGAHLSALVGTDMRYLEKAGLGPDSLAGVIPLDGAAYDVPRQIAEGGQFMHDTYLRAFGDDAARQRALSPTFQATRPNAPAFLILHVARTDGTAQSQALAQALGRAGTPAQVQGFDGNGLRGHMEINRRLGDPDYPATAVVDVWLKRVFAGR
ncbi:alpha/beta hydrolase [Sphingobium aquiterrae]|uniref:alpha/beta hydrolase n=1 Tax=Sphingobium aquiterrae TaxID=2038656 RepID=UPI003017FA65